MSGNRSTSKKEETFSSQRKQFRPECVIKMGPQAKVPYETTYEDEAPKEKQTSAAEQQIKTMVQRQLATDITLESELAREMKFQQATIYKDEQEKRAGEQSLDSFKRHSVLEKELEEMRNCGLTEKEIEIRTTQTLPGSFGKSQLAANRKQEEIEGKIKSREKSLTKVSMFGGVKEMTRHEIEIEQSLYRGTKKAEEFKHLIKAKKKEFADNDPVMKTLREYEEREKMKKKSCSSASKSTKSNNLVDDTDDDDDDDYGKFVGPILAPLHVRIKPMDEKEVKTNKLHLHEIRSIPKFSSYDSGIPNKKLYIKNLPRSATKEDLAELFVRFESADAPCMEYRVLDGRMKGQAFVTFKDVETAGKALEFANGFVLKGKPMIISYGKEGKS